MRLDGVTKVGYLDGPDRAELVDEQCAASAPAATP